MAPDSADVDMDREFYQLLAQTGRKRILVVGRIREGTDALAVIRNEAEDEDTEQKIINEGTSSHSLPLHTLANSRTEYKTWKKNSPFLYDMILRYAACINTLDWY